MFDSIYQSLEEVRETQRIAVDAVRNMQAWFTPLADLDLRELHLVDSRDAAGWHCRPTNTITATVDLGAVQQHVDMVKQCCGRWSQALERLRTEFRSIPPEDIDDLFHAIPELRTDPSLLDLSHSGL